MTPEGEPDPPPANWCCALGGMRTDGGTVLHVLLAVLIGVAGAVALLWCDGRAF
jgi:hypothetical protein